MTYTDSGVCCGSKTHELNPIQTKETLESGPCFGLRLPLRNGSSGTSCDSGTRVGPWVIKIGRGLSP